MQDMINSGAAWLDQQRRLHMAVNVVYQATGAMFPMTVPATIGLSRWDSMDQAGTITRYESRDFFISVSDVSADPVKGDTITETVNGADRIYRVSTPAGAGNHWTWADRGQRVRRIHTHLLDVD